MSNEMTSNHRIAGILLLALLCGMSHQLSAAELKTWDGKHSIEAIDVRVVYFVPKDVPPLPDWKDRVSYFCRRIEQFHAREFQGQSKLTATIHDEVFLSARKTEQLRSGDANFIFFQTLREVDEQLQFGRSERKGFPILLVLSEINWRPLDDFLRLSPQDGELKFEGQVIRGRHFPGAKSGGSRATYLADRGVGWGLVSADGWRVPYCGTDCVVYHEGVGHPIGLPHPEKQNASVMSVAQYRGWLSESFIDLDQKERLGWTAPEAPINRSDLFSEFQAMPEPVVPEPGQRIRLNFQWPSGAQVQSLRVRLQTELYGPWLEVPFEASSDTTPESVTIGAIDRPTPVSYRVDATLMSGETVELWGYFQVRVSPDVSLLPVLSPIGQMLGLDTGGFGAELVLKPRRDEEVDLLAMIDVSRDWQTGQWVKEDGVLLSPKQFGARIEIPWKPATEYEMTVVVEALDEPNGLILGQRSGENRFLTLVNYQRNGAAALSALENIDGANVGQNETTRDEVFLQKGRVSQIICTVRRDSVTVTCDGRSVVEWEGRPDQLSLSDYWKTPSETALFLGAYNCRYRFHRVTITPISGSGESLVIVGE
jgi:hypothetical protein